MATTAMTVLPARMASTGRMALRVSRARTAPTGRMARTGRRRDGSNGKSAYELYLTTLPEGTTPLTFPEWKDSLKGKDGTNGSNGSNGANGVDGKDGNPGHDGIDGKAGAPGQAGKDGGVGRRVRRVRPVLPVRTARLARTLPARSAHDLCGGQRWWQQPQAGARRGLQLGDGQARHLHTGHLAPSSMKKFVDRFMDAWVQCMTRYPRSTTSTRKGWAGLRAGPPSRVVGCNIGVSVALGREHDVAPTLPSIMRAETNEQ